MKIITLVLGVLGGIIGLLSAVAAFVAVGGEAAYSTRLWAGWAALLLALLATAAAFFVTTRPMRASLIMLISGIVGFVCINLFYINTFYGLAVPLWVVAAVVAHQYENTSFRGAQGREMSHLFSTSY
jgi:hypothetical protein